jgi:hypothetical protein
MLLRGPPHAEERSPSRRGLRPLLRTGSASRSMMPAETHSASEYSALLRTDFASFAQHCFHELNPRTLFAASWCHDIIAAKLEAVRTGRSPTRDHQLATAASEVASGLDLLSGLVSGS